VPHPIRAITLALTAVLAAAGAARLTSRDAAAEAAPSLAGRALAIERRIRLVPAADGNEARYRVNEQLAGMELPNDAVGVTKAVTGALVLEDDGRIVRAESKFVVDLTTLASDQSRRDNFIRRNTLETAQYPNAEFVPHEIRGLQGGLPGAEAATLEVVGDLTVHGVTKPVTWRVTARAADGAYTGSASTSFTFEDFGMTKPRLARVLSVKDTIRLEYDFRLLPDPSSQE
jgi:polyisoprenoid-binding protein YceI